METILNKESRAAIELMVADGIIAKDVAERYFPELKESEDERIIGNIIATIHLYYGEPLEDEAKEMIAWLERRGKTFNKKDIDDAYLKGISDAKHELEKQGEQKPVVIIPKFRVGDEIKTSNEESLTITKIDEKGYWSEDLFICCFDEECVWDLVEHNPAWSEEDEMMLECVLDKIGDLGTGEMCKDWLKSFKDRYTWKPTKEQLTELRCVISGCSYDIEPLVELENELKAL